MMTNTSEALGLPTSEQNAFSGVLQIIRDESMAPSLPLRNSSNASAASTESRLDSAKSALASAAYDKAIAILSEELQGNNTVSMLVRYYLSLAYSGLRRSDEALLHATELLKGNPNSTYGYQARGIAYLAGEKYLDALESCSRSIYLGNPTPIAYVIRGFALRGLGRTVESTQEFLAATNLSREASRRFDRIATTTNVENTIQPNAAVRSRSAVGTQAADAEVPKASSALSLWSPTTNPSISPATTPAALELGVKFRSDVAGTVVGVRFFKGPANSGAHTASLWSIGGTRLATTTFANETASGWQEARFSAPVSVAPNTTYVASYHSESSGFAFDALYFHAQGFDSGPLHALQSGLDGLNGLYLYGPSGFPYNSYQDSNYWVDVVFTATISSPATQFYLLHAPSPPSSLLLVLNGLVLRQGIDYLLNGPAISFVAGVEVKQNDIMQAWYRY